MQPPSEATKLETPEGIKEYEGSGKLTGKKALITGGECVLFQPRPRHRHYPYCIQVLSVEAARESVARWQPYSREKAQM